MELKIINFLPLDKNYLVGKIDVCVSYTAEKQEIFRDISYFKKDDKRWCAMPNTKRGEKWLPIYERRPVLSGEIFVKILADIDKFLVDKEMQNN